MTYIKASTNDMATISQRKYSVVIFPCSYKWAYSVVKTIGQVEILPQNWIAV